MEPTWIALSLCGHSDPLVVDQRTVLDRAGAGPDRKLDPFGAMGMRRHEPAVLGRLIDRWRSRPGAPRPRTSRPTRIVSRSATPWG
jgi:hypothetical protein